ncbi:MAG TPA: choice-of-anchor L domain-containing protein [Bacteroidales bacterium]|nr:choice-of-anchor L domain-containing protein [Bacteroidales bacterium]
MKKIIICIICLTAFSITLIYKAQAQLTVTQGASLSMTPLQLVQQILVGSGITVSNATFNGSAASISSDMIGSFTTAGPATTQLGFTGGIMLTSGKASYAIGPNNSGSSGFAAGTGSDPDLQLLIPSHTVNDKAVLEFNFVPISDTVRFRYVFGSEEFDEYCNSSFNDVFGFFISGPGINGTFSNNAINIAYMPGTTNYVTIDNVCACSSSCSWQNTSGVYYQYDRLTHVYTAWCVVQPCQQYHIKLAIGDAGDSSFDSGVFLEENSFSSYGLSYNMSYSSNVDTMAVEGCNNAIVTFSLGQPITTNVVIHYTIAGSAVEGVDYHNVPDSLIIPAGHDSAILTINPILDGITESPETVQIIYVNTVCLTTDTIQIVIMDYNPVTIASITPEVNNCNGQPATLTVTAGGGYTTSSVSYGYEWSNGAGNTASVVVNPSTPTMYYVTVSDACYYYSDSVTYMVTDSVMVNISNLTNQITSVDSVTCYGYQDGSATVTATNGLLPYHYLWSPTNDTNATIDNIGAGTYFVTVTDNIGCTSTNFVILESPPQIGLILTPTDQTCLNSCNGYITSQITGDYEQPVTYAWSTSPMQDSADANNLCPGNYTLTFTYSAHNCFVIANTDISTQTLVSADFTANPAEGFIPLSVDFIYTGSNASTYQWDFGDGTTSTDMHPPAHIYNYMDTNIVVILVVNSGPPNNCEAEYQLIVRAMQPSSMKVPNIFTPNGDGKNDEFQIESEGIRSLEIAIFNRWGKKLYSNSFSDFSVVKTRESIWDGTSKSEGKCADGTYFYFIDAIGYDKKEYHLQGNINLLR